MATISTPVLRVGFMTLSILAVLSGVPRDASAAVPDPRNSVAPECLTICPAGDRPFSVIVRDVGNNPVPGATVKLRVVSSNCPNPMVVFCEDCPEAANYDPVTHTISRTSDVNGVATFRLCGSIFCDHTPHWVEVTADGVLLNTSRFVTTDLDGDLDVDALDVALSTSYEGANHPQADQDCSNNVNPDDTTFLATHLGHVCPGVVPAAPTSWGLMKSIYR